MWLLLLQRLSIEFVLDFFYAPIWWYTGGVKKAFLFCIDLLKNGNTEMAPGLWLKNLFVPMYGQYDWQGRLMSFFMRSVNVVIRSIGLCIWSLVCLAIFMVWLVVPPIFFFLFIRSLM